MAGKINRRRDKSNSRHAGNWHYTADGNRIAYSLVNNAASDFSIPDQYDVQQLLHKNTLKGYDAASDYNPQTSHFLALCMKVVYEKELVIKVRHILYRAAQLCITQ